MAAAGPIRRRFLGFLTSVVLAVIALLVAIPAVGFFLAPLRRKPGTSGAGAPFVDLAPVAQLPVGEWRLLPLEFVQADGWRRTTVRHSVWVRRNSTADEDFTVLSSICPHLGCPINWNPGQGQFLCPCHGGHFAADGRRIAGPPPRGMDPLEFDVRGGRLWVRWQDFKIGSAERVPVNV
jgi:Rieske Fe-S protein